MKINKGLNIIRQWIIDRKKEEGFGIGFPTIYDSFIAKVFRKSYVSIPENIESD